MWSPASEVVRRRRQGVEYRPVMIEALESRRLLSIAAPSAADTQRLTKADVEQILARAGSAASIRQIIAVVDRQGNVLGALGVSSHALNSNSQDLPTPPPGETPVPEQTLLNA